MNPALTARERASERGALDPRPEPPPILTQPTRLHRIVVDEAEIWLDPRTGRPIEPEIAQ